MTMSSFIVCHVAVSDVAPWIPSCTHGRSSFTGWRGIATSFALWWLWAMDVGGGQWWQWRRRDGGDETMVVRRQWWMGVVDGGGGGGWGRRNWWVDDARFGHRRFHSSHSGAIPSMWFLEPFRQNVNSVSHSAGIVLSIWQATVPKLIPTEFRELTGFRWIPAGISGGQ